MQNVPIGQRLADTGLAAQDRTDDPGGVGGHPGSHREPMSRPESTRRRLAACVSALALAIMASGCIGHAPTPIDRDGARTKVASTSTTSTTMPVAHEQVPATSGMWDTGVPAVACRAAGCMRLGEVQTRPTPIGR